MRGTSEKHNGSFADGFFRRLFEIGSPMSTTRCGRFFFNIRSEQDLIRDYSGCVLPDIEAAISAALVGGLQIRPDAGCLRQPQQFEITSEDGKLVAIVPIDY
ncbi:DUF6894 family protein [Hyphomicrobiales bacterium]|jgi:hypothetical protein|uniref:DUF6894 family protein n=1 Tax=Rhizobium leguminosarum TaxID=384 RepID=UPI0013B048E7